MLLLADEGPHGPAKTDRAIVEALGVNVNFDPCVDILYNWRNTIVNTRAHGTNADDVIRYTDAYVQGLRAGGEVLCCIKHFPGDGTEERDQHLVLGVNELSPEQWAAYVAAEAARIDYANFNNSVAADEPARSSAYMKCWEAMYLFQEAHAQFNHWVDD